MHKTNFSLLVSSFLYEQVFGFRQKDDSLYKKLNIVNYARDKDTPTIIVQGDSMVAVQSVKNFYKDMAVKNKTIVYLELPRCQHVFDMFPTTAWNRYEKEITGFIRELTKQ